MRTSVLSITIDDDESGVGEYWILSCYASNAFEVDRLFDGVCAMRCSTNLDVVDQHVPWNEVPASHREHAVSLFRAAGFTDDEIARERVISEDSED